MGETGTIEARRLLRRAKLGRFAFLPSFLRSRGLEASDELQAAARSGDLTVLRVLAAPTPQPDPLFSSVWRDLVDSTPGLRAHLHRAGGGYENGYAAYGRADRVSRDLAQLVLYPEAGVLTEDMQRIVAVAAALRDHPLAEIARQKILIVDDRRVDDQVCELAEFVPGLGSFCREQGLVPSAPARRPVFWLLTGQYSRYRSADPYGSVAVAAYTSADGDMRARLSSAAIDGGLFELLRRMTEAEGEFADLLQGEQFTALSTGLAQHERWSLLWELLSQVPVAVAVEVSRLFPEDWQPSTARDQHLLAALRGAPPDLITATTASRRGPARSARPSQ